MYGFLDEAGDVGYKKKGATTHFLAVVVLLAEQPDRLRQAVTRTRKGLGKQCRSIPEFKGRQTDDRIKKKLIEQAQKRADFKIIVTVLDKRKIPEPEDKEELYREACRRVLRRCFEEGNSLNLVIDKRYTNPRMRQELTKLLQNEAHSLGKTLSVQHRDSQTDRALQVTDEILSVIFQKYEHGKLDLFSMIERQIIVATK